MRWSAILRRSTMFWTGAVSRSALRQRWQPVFRRTAAA
nr:MAG TPA: hypothetical protein [Caudoviricetes sp.]